MSSTLWLHVGPNKTGTTTIQSMLSTYRDALPSHGLLYPRLPGPKEGNLPRTHHHLAKRLLNPDQPDPRTWLPGVVETLPDGPSVILSSEVFSRHGADALDRLRAMADAFARRFRTRVIFYARHPLDHATSRAQEAVKSGKQTLDHAITSAKRFPIRARITAFVEAFGKENVDVRPFIVDRMVNRDLVSDFCHAIGKPGLLDGLDRPYLNPSITMEAARAIDRYRRETGDTSRISATDPRFAVPGNTRFALAPECADRIMQQSRKDLDWLAETYGIVFPEDRADAVTKRRAAQA